MTEALKKWLEARQNEAARSQGWDKEAEFWLRAFVEEVERRAQELCKDHIGFSVMSSGTTNITTCRSSKGEALSNLKRELLGE